MLVCPRLHLLVVVVLSASYCKVRCDDIGYAPSSRYYPWHAHIQSSLHPRGGCGGSLIADNAVITAAVCIVNPQAVIKVALGTITIDENTRWRDTNLSLIHPGYSNSSEGLSSNIALVFLKESIQPSDSLKPILWKNAQELVEQQGAIKRLQTIGFKKTFAGRKPQYRLAFYFLQFTAEKECDKYRTAGNPKADQAFCVTYAQAGVVPAHLGDTGSALIAEPEDPTLGNHVMIGIATWHPIDSFRDSAFLALRIENFKGWIQRWLDLYPALHSQQTCSCTCPTCPPRRTCPPKHRNS